MAIFCYVKWVKIKLEDFCFEYFRIGKLNQDQYYGLYELSKTILFLLYIYN